MKIDPNIALTIAAAGILLLTGCNDKNIYANVDANNDEKVSRAEFRQAVQQDAFEHLDANGDGVIDLEEWKAVEDVRQPIKRFESLDADENAELSFEEFSTATRKKRALDHMFGTMDVDGDGFITDDDVLRP